MAVLQLSFQKTILNLFFACADNEQAVDNLNFRSEDLLTDLTTTTDKEIQARNKARDATKQRGQLHGVHEFGMTR